MNYSYKSSDPAAKSSVIVLRDGRAMEIRRGDQTVFAEKERRFWTSLSEWMATLPDGATVTKKAPAARKRPAKPVVTNPVLLRFMERVKEAGHRLRPFTMRYAGTRAEVVRGEKQWRVDFFTRGWSAGKGAEEHARELAALDGRLAALSAEGKADLSVFYAYGSASYITQTADGELQEVRWSKEHNVIGYFSNRKSIEWENRVLSVDFTPLTDPVMPLWQLNRGEAPVRV